MAEGCAEMRAIVGADSCGECLTSHGEDYPAALLLDVRPLKSQAGHTMPLAMARGA